MSNSKKYRVPANNHDYRKIVGDLESADLSASEMMVLSVLAHHTDENGYCFPSQKRLAKKSKYTVRTNQRSLKSLTTKKYIRKVSRTRTGFRNGSCAYAVTVSAGTATRHHVEATRQFVISEPDTVSELNRSTEQISEQLVDPIRLVGDKFLLVLEPIIDFSQSPWMISTAQICKRLFNACLPTDFEATLTRALIDADQLCAQYERSEKKLTSWMPLIERMQLDNQEPAHPDQPIALVNEEPLVPLLEELQSYLRASVRNDPRVKLELLRLAAFESPDAIELSSQSRMTIDQVYEFARSALRLLASSYGKRIVLKHNGAIIHQVKL